MNILEKLLNIQQELKCEKSQYNSFGKYNYRNAEDILESLKPLLKKYECIIRISDEVVNIGNNNYVKATSSLISCEKQGELISEINSCAYAREAIEQKDMNDSQITGSTSSYARKYALNGLFAIDDTKDSDTTNIHGNDQETQTNVPQTHVEEFKKTLEECKCEKCGIKISENVKRFSLKAYNVERCMQCQKELTK